MTDHLNYQDLFENAPIAYFSVSNSGHILNANRKASMLLGYSLEDLLKIPVFHLYADTPDGKIKAQKIFKKFLAGESIQDEELEMQKCDETPIWVSLTMQPVYNSAGQTVESRSIVLDITERKRAQEILQDAERYKVLMETAGAAAHEINQPLTVIVGLSEVLLRTQELPDTYKVNIEQIYNASLRIHKIVGNMKQIQKYATKSYIGENEIVDFKNSTNAPE